MAGFYARMLDHDYTTRDLFNKNFFKDWRKVVQLEIVALLSCLYSSHNLMDHCFRRLKHMYGLYGVVCNNNNDDDDDDDDDDLSKVMTSEEKSLIVDLKKCNFKEIGEYFKLKSEEKKNISKEEKQVSNSVKVIR